MAPEQLAERVPRLCPGTRAAGVGMPVIDVTVPVAVTIVLRIGVHERHISTGTPLQPVANSNFVATAGVHARKDCDATSSVWRAPDRPVGFKYSFAQSI